jgi:hypothetical protein
MVFKELKKEFITRTKSYFNDFGFAMTIFDKTGYRIENDTENLLLVSGFGCYDRSAGYELTGGGQQILFKQVEAIIYPLIVKHKLWDTATEPLEWGTSLGNHENNEITKMWYEKFEKIRIDSIEELEEYISLLKLYIEQYALPWFERYSKLEEVNGLINELGMQDILNCFSAPFPTQFYRAMVITEMCNNRARTLEIRDECLRRFADCKKDSFYTPLMIASYEESLQDLCALYNID